nr:putative transcription factor [Ogataea minuta]
MSKRKASISSSTALAGGAPIAPITASSSASSAGADRSNSHQMKQVLSNPPKIIMPSASDGSTGIVLQKKRRVVRACDRCRKLKIKCSGDMPCIHCTVYSYECTYDQPNRSKKKPAVYTNQTSSGALTASACQQLPSNGNTRELMAKMTDRLKLYDDILHRLLPEVKLTDLNDNPKPINPFKLISALNNIREKGGANSSNSSKSIAEEYLAMPDVPVPHLPVVPKLPPNAGSPIGQAPVGSSKPQNALPQEPSLLANSPNAMHAGIDGSYESSMGKEIKIILPSREIALQLITKTWENACVLFRFYHRPAFVEDLNELYDTDPGQYTNKQQRFLPLVYSVMACGALFFKSDEQTTGKMTEENDLQSEVFDDEGYKYFIAARRLIDITDTRDTYGIQTIVMLIIFLQCSARLSTCYAYIGIALRAALREGLHRKLDYPFNPIELEIRKRLFWTIYKMDIYVNTMLGLPRTISEDDFDQDMPIELDDENITVDGYRFEMQGDRLSSSGIANAHTTLIFIMKRIVTKLYPIKPRKVENGSRPELLAHDIVYQLELELQDWMNSLPLELKPGVEPSGQYLKANRLLHISYLHVKIILYRPFIHYISADFSSGHRSSNDLKCIDKAKNCINVARVVVKLAEDMINKKMLSGSYWFSIYTIFFSVACLVYYVHFAPPINSDGQFDREYLSIKKDAESGKRVLDILKDSSMAAKRTYNILNALFEQLNRRTANASINNELPDPQFITPQVGKTQFEREQTKQQESKKAAIPLPPQQPQKKSPQLQNSGRRPVKQQFNNKYSETEPLPTPKLENSEIDSLVNGVNFIDGVSTGISLKVPAHRTQQERQRDFEEAQVEREIQRQARTDGAEDGATQSPEYPNKYKYVPGPMDQLDMKIFGRFLPPYMLNPQSDETTPVSSSLFQTEQNQPGEPSESSPREPKEQSQQYDSLGSHQVNLSQQPSNFSQAQSSAADLFGVFNSSIPSGLSTISHAQNQPSSNRVFDGVNAAGSTSIDELKDYPSADRKYEFDDFFFSDWSAGFPSDFNTNASVPGQSQENSQ